MHPRPTDGVRRRPGGAARLAAVAAAAALALTTWAPSAVAADALPDPVLDLAFDGDVADASPLAHPVTLKGHAGSAPTGYSYVDGVDGAGQALRLSGSTYLDLGSSTALQPEDLTLSFWVEPSGKLSGEHVITWNKQAYNSDGFYLSSESDTVPLTLSVGPASGQPYKVRVASFRPCGVLPGGRVDARRRHVRPRDEGRGVLPQRRDGPVHGRQRRRRRRDGRARLRPGPAQDDRVQRTAVQRCLPPGRARRLPPVRRRRGPGRRRRALRGERAHGRPRRDRPGRRRRAVVARARDRRARAADDGLARLDRDVAVVAPGDRRDRRDRGPADDRGGRRARHAHRDRALPGRRARDARPGSRRARARRRDAARGHRAAVRAALRRLPPERRGEGARVPAEPRLRDVPLRVLQGRRAHPDHRRRVRRLGAQQRRELPRPRVRALPLGARDVVVLDPGPGDQGRAVHRDRGGRGRARARAGRVRRRPPRLGRVRLRVPRVDPRPGAGHRDVGRERHRALVQPAQGARRAARRRRVRRRPRRGPGARRRDRVRPLRAGARREASRTPTSCSAPSTAA